MRGAQDGGGNGRSRPMNEVDCVNDLIPYHEDDREPHPVFSV